MDRDTVVWSTLFLSDADGDAPAIQFTAEDLRRGSERRVSLDDVAVSVKRGPHDAPDVRRLAIEFGDGEIELQPTKGLSIGPYRFRRWRPFWEPVIPGIISPDAERLLGDVLVLGEPVAALRWIENFSGCIELLGLSNWGMPRRDHDSGLMLPLHGEAARIPVQAVSVNVLKSYVVVSAAFSLNSTWWREPENGRPWYSRGQPDWRITRTVIVEIEHPRMRMVDTIENTGTVRAVPDWGYHVQLRAEPGAQLVIPSRSVAKRNGLAPENSRHWVPPPESDKRVERGYVHRGLNRQPGPFDTDVVCGVAAYRDGSATLFTMPAATYTLSWFSAGGKGGLEFAVPESPHSGISTAAWDGMGPEIGASPLDHDGTADPEIVHRALEPGQSTRLFFSIECVEAAAVRDLLRTGAS